MSTIIEDLADPALLGAVDLNFTEEMSCFGRGLPGADLHEDPELTWVITGPGRPNGVLRTKFARADSAYVDARVAATIGHFKARQIETMSWRIGPTTSPLDLAMYLQAHCFIHQSERICMILDVAHAQAAMPLPEGLTIKEAEDEAAMVVKRAVEQRGFGTTAQAAQDYHQIYMHSGFGEGHAWHHYIGWLHNTPVAMSSLLLYGGIAGIYGVATVPEARRCGIGAAMTLHAVREAARLGYHVATLSPTEMSFAIYQRLGFRERCKMHFYTLSIK